MQERIAEALGILPAFVAHFIGLAAFIVVIGLLVWRDERGPKD